MTCESGGSVDAEVCQDLNHTSEGMWVNFENRANPSKAYMGILVIRIWEVLYYVLFAWVLTSEPFYPTYLLLLFWWNSFPFLPAVLPLPILYFDLVQALFYFTSECFASVITVAYLEWYLRFFALYFFVYYGLYYGPIFTKPCSPYKFRCSNNACTRFHMETPSSTCLTQ